MSGDDSVPILYSYWRSSCSWRVRLALAAKGVEYEYRATHLVKGEHLTDDYVSTVNPSHSVPALLIDGLVLSQSVAIMEYLDESRPDQGVPLLPREPALRAQVRRLALAIAADIQPVQNLRVLRYVGMERKMEWGEHWIKEGFQALERMLEKTAGKFCLGDTLSMADMCLVPQVYNANRFGVNMDEFPIISRINAHCETLDVFKGAHPDAQPDAQTAS